MKGHQLVIVSFPQLRMTVKWQLLAVHRDVVSHWVLQQIVFQPSRVHSVFAQGARDADQKIELKVHFHVRRLQSQ